MDARVYRLSYDNGGQGQEPIPLVDQLETMMVS